MIRAEFDNDTLDCRVVVDMSMYGGNLLESISNASIEIKGVLFSIMMKVYQQYLENPAIEVDDEIAEGLRFVMADAIGLTGLEDFEEFLIMHKGSLR